MANLLATCATNYGSSTMCWSSGDMKAANFWVCSGDDSFSMGQGGTLFDLWVSDSSISHQPRSIIRAYNQGNCIVLGLGCNANTNATIPVYACHSVKAPYFCATSCFKTYGAGAQSVIIGSTNDNATLFLDGSDGDVSGSDYAWIRHDNNKVLFIENDLSASNICIWNRSNSAICFGTNNSGRFVIHNGGTVQACGVLCANSSIVSCATVQGTKVCLTGTTGDNASPRGEIAKHVRWNYSSAACWRVCTTGNNSQCSPDGQNFNANGDGNRTCFGVDPFGRQSLIWHGYQNDASSDADGGWNKALCNLDPKRSYMSVIYFKKLVAGGDSGTFYHGTGTGTNNIRNTNGDANTNPYFFNSNLSNFQTGQWYVSIGYIHGCDNTSTSSDGGVYRLCDGTKTLTNSTFRMGSTTCLTNGHRVYLYYSDGGDEVVQWWGPGFYEINGMEPSYGELLNGNPAAHNHSSDVCNMLRIACVGANTCVCSPIVCAVTCVQANTIGVGRTAHATYPLMLKGNTRYQFAICNSGSGDSDYPWLAHDNDNLVIHFNGIADRYCFHNSGAFCANACVKSPAILGTSWVCSSDRMVADTCMQSPILCGTTCLETNIIRNKTGNLYLNVYSGCNDSQPGGIYFRSCGGTSRGYVYFDGTSNFGLLNCSGQWALRIVGNHSSGSMYTCHPLTAATCVATPMVCATSGSFYLKLNSGIINVPTAYINTINNSSSTTVLNISGGHTQACTCLQSPIVCTTTKFQGNCLHIDGGAQNAGQDATAYITSTSNNDWALLINKNNGSATEYGLDLRMGATSTAAIYARFNNTIKFQVGYNSLCHSGCLVSPKIFPTGCLLFDQSGTRSWYMCAAGGRLNVHSGDGAGTFHVTMQQTIRGIDNNSGKADLSVDTGGNATIALSDQYFRVGSDDVNWSVRIKNTGMFETYGQNLILQTMSGDRNIKLCPSGTGFVCSTAAVCSTSCFRAHTICGTCAICVTDAGTDNSNGSKNHISLGNHQVLPQASWSESSCKVGRIEIELPDNGGSTYYGMYHFVVDMYEYCGNKVASFEVGGHNWACTWYNCGANMIAGCTDKPVKLAYCACGTTNCAGRNYIIIGNADSIWCYGHVVVSRATNAAFYNYPQIINGTYNITRVTSADNSYGWLSSDLLLKGVSKHSCYLGNYDKNSGCVRFGNVLVGSQATYNTLMGCEQLHVRAGSNHSWNCNIIVGDGGGSTKTYICNCVQSPIVCGTTAVNTDAICVASVASISGDTDYEGLAVGQAYSNEGGWNTQLNMYGRYHTILRIKKCAGTTADNAQCLSLYVHDNHAAHIISTGNMAFKAAGGYGLCLKSGVACSAILCGTTCVYGTHLRTCCCLCFSGQNLAFYTTASHLMALCSNHANTVALRFDSNQGVEGYVYADNGHMGFLDKDGAWFYFQKNDSCHIWRTNNVQQMCMSGNVLCHCHSICSNHNMVSNVICATGCLSSHVLTSGANNLCLCPTGCGYGIFFGGTHSGGEKQHWTTSVFAANAAQARRAKLLEFTYNTHHWESGGPIFIDIYHNYFGKASHQRWQVQFTGLDGSGSQNCSAGADLPAGARDVRLMLLESNGQDPHFYKLHADMHAAGFKISDYDVGVAEIYLDVDYYTQVNAKVTMHGSWDNINTGSSWSTSSSNQYKFYNSPSYSNITTFYNSPPTVPNVAGRSLYAEAIYGCSNWEACCQTCYTNLCTRYLCPGDVSCLTHVKTSGIVCASTIVQGCYVCWTCRACQGDWIYASNQYGTYWSGHCGLHLYPAEVDHSRLHLRSTKANTALVLTTCNNTTKRGYLYANCDNYFGLLDSTGTWRVQVVSNAFINLCNTTCVHSILCATGCVQSPVLCFSSCLRATGGCVKAPIIEARYSDDNINHRGGICWRHLQLGNNGGNTIFAGKNTTGGWLDIYTNTTNDMLGGTTYDGCHVARFNCNGYTIFYDWIQVAASKGIYGATNNGHFYLNTSSTYGAWALSGARNDWNGIYMCGMTVMAKNDCCCHGLFNDVDDEWMVRTFKNGNVQLFYNGAERLDTYSNGIIVCANSNTTCIYPHASWSHFYTTASKYYFDREVHVNSGVVSSYDEPLKLATCGTVRAQVCETCLCSSILFCAPSAHVSSYVNSGKFCSGSTYLCSGCLDTGDITASGTILSADTIESLNKVCATNGFYGDGSNLTGISAGSSFTCESTLACGTIMIGCCAGKCQGFYCGSCFCNNACENTVLGVCAFYNVNCQAYANGSEKNVVIGYASAYGGFRSGQNTIVGAFALRCTFDYPGNTGNLVGASGTTAIGICSLYGGGSSCKLYCTYEDVFVGKSSGYYLVCSCRNVGIGRAALMGSSSGNVRFCCSIGIGPYAGSGQCVSCNNIAIGYCACIPGGNTVCNTITIGNSSHGNGYLCASCWTVYGHLSKSSGSFRIVHPDPVKSETKDLWHSFVESPTEGENIYRWQVETSNCAATIILPDYYKHLNKDDMVWVSPYKNFGVGYGEVTADQCCLVVCSNSDGCYNVLLLGTRKDTAGVEAWKGAERNIGAGSLNSRYNDDTEVWERYDPSDEVDEDEETP